MTVYESNQQSTNGERVGGRQGIKWLYTPGKQKVLACRKATSFKYNCPATRRSNGASIHHPIYLVHIFRIHYALLVIHPSLNATPP